MRKKSIALSMSLALVGGLFAAALGNSASAATVKEHDTEFTVMKYNDGRFSGRIAGKRFLCLQDQEVVILKKTPDGTKEIAVATINVGRDTWQNFGEGRFTVKHPGLQITNRFKRMRALKGNYFAKYVGGPVADYGRAGVCLASKSDTVSF